MANLKCNSCGYEAQNDQDLQKHKQTAHQGSESGGAQNRQGRQSEGEGMNDED